MSKTIQRIIYVGVIFITIVIAEQYHPQDDMEDFECYAEYGMNCEEAEQYEQDNYDEENEYDEDENEDTDTSN